MRLLVLAAVLAPAVVHAAPDLTKAQTDRIDAATNQTLQLTGVPGASVAVVKDGKIVYVQAYGLARISPPKK